jgi:signal peptidase I
MKDTMKEILDWMKHIAIGIAIALFLVNFCIQRTVVYGSSMEPTLHDGNNLVVEKVTTRFGKFNYGDIVIIDASEFMLPGNELIIKRIIALENDEVEIKDGKVYVNNKEVIEPYVSVSTTLPINPKYSKIKVPEGHVYVMGDNRYPNASNDSRIIGPVSIRKIRGKAVLRIYPFSEFGILKR